MTIEITTLENPTASELDQLMSIWLTSNLDAHGFIDPHYWQANVPAVREALGEAELIVAKNGAAIVGFAGLQGDFLAGLFVDATWRDRGIGGLLMAACQAAHARLSLEVYVANSRAGDFYLHHDFHVSGRTVDQGEPVLEMSWHR
ncbi:GNAT family N-acetyltransferase [Lacticaseibacillus mingshuiensis]|uniref:GNAT family N-acetyltransferase n=1 Tax=Lacticaseibacillus mingshuiensis TaxID=2799574 RepID=A0ABW4CFW6_9LACO|nr:GNAT family N-acetyltransferase [Lacticaseibacillus mingshuiensis]